MTYNSSKTGAQVDAVVDAGQPGGSTLYGVSNLLGTVSQSGGVPTGAVIERGSNANGEYVKFADGTMICRYWATSAFTTSVAVGSLFFTTQRNITLPATFVDTNYNIIPVGVDNGNALIGAALTGSKTVSSFRLFPAGLTNTASVFPSYVAIGRWF